MTNNAADTKFWTPTLTDIWYQCNLPIIPPTYGLPATPNKCATPDNTWNVDAVTVEGSSTNNWSTFEIDNDASAPWCTPPDSKTYSPYACTALKCIMQRPLISPDYTHDWSFDSVVNSPTVLNTYKLSTETSVNPAADYMIIQTGRAKVWIGSATYTAAMAGPSRPTNDLFASGFKTGYNGYIAIPIVKGANALIQASASLIALSYIFL